METGRQASSKRISYPATFSEKELFELKPEEGETFRHVNNWERITHPTFPKKWHTLRLSTNVCGVCVLRILSAQLWDMPSHLKHFSQHLSSVGSVRQLGYASLWARWAAEVKITGELPCADSPARISSSLHPRRSAPHLLRNLGYTALLSEDHLSLLQVGAGRLMSSST